MKRSFSAVLNHARAVVRRWLRHTWISRLPLGGSFRTWYRRSRTKRSPRRVQPSFRPVLEGLESREVPGSVLDVLAAPALLANLEQNNDDLASNTTALLNGASPSLADNGRTPLFNNLSTVADNESQWQQMLQGLTTDWKQDIQLVSQQLAAAENTSLGQNEEQTDQPSASNSGNSANGFDPLFNNAGPTVSNAGKQPGLNNSPSMPPVNNGSKMAGAGGGGGGGASTHNPSGGGGGAPGSGGSANLQLPSPIELQQMTSGSNVGTPTPSTPPFSGGGGTNGAPGQQSQTNTAGNTVNITLPAAGSPSSSSMPFAPMDLPNSGQQIPQTASTTSLTASNSSVAPGQNVTFTATVNASGGSTTPTGTVAFYDGQSYLGSGTLAVTNGNNQATLSTTSLPAGSQAIVAIYGGNNTVAASNASLTETVQPAVTSLSLMSSSFGSNTPGQSVTLTATVSVVSGSGAPTGTVTFYDGSTSLGYGTLSLVYGQYQATLTTTALTASGYHDLTAVYGGDSTHAGSIAAMTETVAPAVTSLSLASSSYGSNTPGQSVTLTATVSVVSGSGAPTGTVTFYDGSTSLGYGTLSLVYGQYQATLTTTALTASGYHDLAAVYGGDSTHAGSVAALSELVAPGLTTLTLSSSTGSVQPGQPVTFTATVSGTGTPNGSVDFYVGANYLGSATLTLVSGQNQASLTTSSLTTSGSYDITALYDGNSTFAGSNSSLTQFVAGTGTGKTTSTSLSTSANPSLPGQDVTFTAIVSGSGGTPTGTVTFYDGATSLGSASLNWVDNQDQASVTVSDLTPGPHTISAIYGGDSTFLASTATLPYSQHQNVNAGNASEQLTSSVNPSLPGQSVTFTATLTGSASGGTPTGTVTFYDGANSLGSSALNSQGQASVTVSTLALGSQKITALYGGSSLYATTSATLPYSGLQNVNAGNATQELTSSVNPSLPGQPVTFTATLTGSPSGGTPTGTVAFYDGDNSLGSFDLNSQGQASVTTTNLALGSQQIRAIYSGDSVYGSSSATLPYSGLQNVNLGNVTAQLASSANPSLPGQPVTFTATLTGSASGGTPTGTVTFYDGANSLGSTALNDQGQASVTVSTLAVGSHEITVLYSGSNVYASTSATLSYSRMQNVNQANAFEQLTSTDTTAQPNQAVTFTATLSGSNGGTPTGSVAFYDGQTLLSTVALASVNGQDQASFTDSNLTAGKHDLIAIYSGDSTYASNDAALTQTMLAATTTSLDMPTVSGSTTSITVTVQPQTPVQGTPTGYVTLYNGSTWLASQQLPAGQDQVTFTITTPSGTPAFGAVYSGDANFASSSEALTIVAISPISATPNQVVNTGPFVTFTDSNTSTPASDFTAQIDWGDGNSPTTGTVAALGNGAFTVSRSYTYTMAGSYPVNVTISDNDGNQTTASTTATVAAPIVISSPGDQSNAEGDTVSLQIQASGGSGALSFGSSNLPAGLTIDSTTGIISGTVNYTDAQTQGGLYPVTITACDDAGDSASTSFNWSIAPTVTTPTLTNPGDVTNWVGDPVELQLSASDADGDTLTYAASGLPGGLTLNTTTGLITGVLADTDGPDSPYNITVSASDGANTVSQSFTWTVAALQIDAVADQTNLLGDTVSLPMNAWGMSGQTLTYSAAGLPPGLSINANTGLISGTIANTDSITTPYNVTVTATDGSDPASTSFAWNLSSFTLDNPGDQSNVEGDAVALQPTIETNGDPTLTFSAAGLPPGLSINPNTGLIAGTIANLDSNNSPYNVTVSATDGTSTSSQTYTWTVTYVTITDPGDQINAPGDVVSLPIQASDPANDTLSYSVSGLPQGLNINSTTGLISGTIADTAGSDTPYSVTVTATNGTQTATDTFNWTVANQAVTVINPGTQNNDEGDNVSLQINAVDPSYNGLDFTATGLPTGLQIDYASGLISGTIDDEAAQTNGGVYQVTVLADDGQGNNGSTTFTWNVSPAYQTPILDNPGDQLDNVGDVVSLPLDGYDDDGDNVTYTATGLPPGLSLDPNAGIISGTLGAAAASTTPYSVTVTAADGTLTTSQSFNWFVLGNPVALTSPGDQTNNEGDVVSLQLSATDANDSTLTYQASGLPSGLSINNNTGLISGTVASGDSADGPYVVTVTASDADSYSSAQEFVWNVNPANLNPVVANPGSQINAQGDVLSLQMQATDPAGNGLTYSTTGLPPGLTLNADNGLISGVLPNNSASSSPYSVTVTATDGSYSGSSTFAWSVVNQAVTLTNPGTQSNNGGDSVSLQINASDPAQLPLTYTAVGLPDGLSLDPNSGLISGNIDTSAGGTYAVTVMASDSQGNSGSAAFTWNVVYVNQTPILDNPGDQLDNAGDVVSLQLSGYALDGDSLSYSAVGLPQGLSIDPSSGIISGVLDASAASPTPYSVTVTAADGTLTASQSFNWFVLGNPVTLASPGDQTNNEGDTVSLQLSATDANNSALTYQASGLPSGLSINSSTGLISGTVASGDSADGPYEVTVTASDTQGYSSAQQFAWNVNAPASGLTLTNPGNQNNSESDNVSLQVQASDTDGDFLEYTASGLPVGLMIDPLTGLISGTVDYGAAAISGGQYNVTVAVSDGNGDSASQSITWLIAATPQPPWLVYPTLQNNAIGDQVALQLQAGSPDGAALTYTANNLPPGLTLNAATGLISGQIAGAANDYNVTVTVTDTSNLSATQTFTWQVSNTPAPQVILAVNGTTSASGDVAVVNAQGSVPLTITLENASPNELHLIQISIPSGRSLVSEPAVELANGGTTTVWLTPVQQSQSADDVDIQVSVDGLLAADKKMTNEQITIQSGGAVNHVVNADTPSGMADRIPPSADGAVTTAVTITFSVALGAGETLWASFTGVSADNGEVKFKDGDNQWSAIAYTGGTAGGAKGGHVVNIWGISQTKPGQAGKLQLSVGYGPDPSKDDRNSAGFSVAAIPVGVQFSLINPPLRGVDLSKKDNPKYSIAWGVQYNIIIKSDSGNVNDLNEILISEQIQPDKSNPTVGGLITSDFLPADKPQVDTNAKNYLVPKNLDGTPIPLAFARKSALELLQAAINKSETKSITDIFLQHFEFKDNRTGTVSADGKPLVYTVANSGFKIERTQKKQGATYLVIVTRSGATVGTAQPGSITEGDSKPQEVKVE